MPETVIIEDIKQKLAVLAPAHVDVQDDSWQHVGHEGAAGGGGHYTVIIVSNDFSNKHTVTRHRMVYQALNGMMHKQIHALSIQALTPEEFFSNSL